MTDPVLTAEEKDALLEGVQSGAIEVQSTDGPRYAEVKPFEIGARSRIATNSYPRLQQLNLQLAGRMRKQTEQLIAAETAITPAAIETCTFGEFVERSVQGRAMILEFEAQPLDGTGLIYLDSLVVGHLVEAFFGGHANEAARSSENPFTPGEKSVAALFTDDLLATIAELWQPLVELKMTRISVRDSSDILDGVDAGDTVLATTFEIRFGDEPRNFHVVWPHTMIASLIPVFDGQKRERDRAEDLRWQQAIRARVPKSMVRISSQVGRARMTIRDVAALEAGDVIDIDDPSSGTVYVDRVPVLDGRFGVHEGHFAMQAIRWRSQPDDIPTT